MILHRDARYSKAPVISSSPYHSLEYTRRLSTHTDQALDRSCRTDECSYEDKKLIDELILLLYSLRTLLSLSFNLD